MAGNNSIGKASLILTANSKQMEKGLDKAKEKFSAFKLGFLGGLVGGFAGGLFSKFTKGLTDNLEDSIKEFGRKASDIIEGIFTGNSKLFDSTSALASAADAAAKGFKDGAEKYSRDQFDKARAGTEALRDALDKLTKTATELDLSKLKESLAGLDEGKSKKAIDDRRRALEALEDEQKAQEEEMRQLKELIELDAERNRILDEQMTKEEQLEAAMRRLRKVRDESLGGLNEEQFGKAAKAAREKIFGDEKSQFKFSPADQIGSRESGEAILRARFGRPDGGGDPAKEVPKKIDTTNKLLEQQNKTSEQVYQEIKAKMAAQIVFREFNP